MGDSYKEIIADRHQREMDWVNRKFDQIRDSVNELDMLSVGYADIKKRTDAETESLLKRAESFDEAVLPKRETAYTATQVVQTMDGTSVGQPLVRNSYTDGMVGVAILLTTMLAIGAYLKRRRV